MMLPQAALHTVLSISNNLSLKLVNIEAQASTLLSHCLVIHIPSVEHTYSNM
jgi:hypothetical protein